MTKPYVQTLQCELGRERCRWCWEESQVTHDLVVLPPAEMWPGLNSIENLSLLDLPEREFEAMWHMSK